MGNSLSLNGKNLSEEPRSLLIDRQPISLPDHIIVPRPFPLEIWHHIINQLQSDGRSHTKLTAISWTWRAISLPFYFQSIALHGRLSIELFLAAYEYALPEEACVRDLLLTGDTSVKKGTPEPPKWERSLRNTSFNTLYHGLLELLASSLENLTVTYLLTTHLLPVVAYPCLRSLTANAATFNSSYDLPHIPSLRRMHFFGPSLNHGSFDVLSHIAPNLEELRLTYSRGERHTTSISGIRLILSMDKDAYQPSHRRLWKWVGGTAGQSKNRDGEDELAYLVPPILPHLQVIHIEQSPCAHLGDGRIDAYTGPVHLLVSPLQGCDYDAVVQDIVSGWQEPYVAYRT